LETRDVLSRVLLSPLQLLQAAAMAAFFCLAGEHMPLP